MEKNVILASEIFAYINYEVCVILCVEYLHFYYWSFVVDLES